VAGRAFANSHELRGDLLVNRELENIRRLHVRVQTWFPFSCFKVCKHPNPNFLTITGFQTFVRPYLKNLRNLRICRKRGQAIVAPLELQNRALTSTNTMKILSGSISQFRATRSVKAELREFRFKSGIPILRNSRKAVGPSSPAQLIRTPGAKLTIT
jgi:hypothetical protein